MEVNEEKRKKFMEYAEKRVNNVMHDISILEPMARSNSYDFTKADVEEMFAAMQKSLDNAKSEYYKKFEAKARTVKKSFSFGSASSEEVLGNKENVETENNTQNVIIEEENEVKESENNIVGSPDEVMTEIF